MGAIGSPGFYLAIESVECWIPAYSHLSGSALLFSKVIAPIYTPSSRVRWKALIKVWNDMYFVTVRLVPTSSTSL